MNAIAPNITTDGEPYWYGNSLFEFLVPAAATGGAMSVFRSTMPAGFGPPRHIHTREDEVFFVEDGEALFDVDGRILGAGAGMTVFMPRGVPHTFKNVGAHPGSFIGFTSPCGFERFVAAVATKTPPTSKEVDPAVVRRLLELAPEFGIDMNPKLSDMPIDAGAWRTYAAAIEDRYPPARRPGGLVRRATAAAGRALLRSPAFTRHVLLDRWFLRLNGA